jgi:hypothetical protein
MKKITTIIIILVFCISSLFCVTKDDLNNSTKEIKDSIISNSINHLDMIKNDSKENTNIISNKIDNAKNEVLEAVSLKSQENNQKILKGPLKTSKKANKKIKTKVHNKVLSIEEQEFINVLKQPKDFNINNVTSEVNCDKKYIEDFAIITNTNNKNNYPNQNELVNPLTPEKAINKGDKLIEHKQNEEYEIILDNIPGSSEKKVIKKNMKINDINYVIKIEPNTLEQVILILKKDLEANFEVIRKALLDKRVELQKDYDDLMVQNQSVINRLESLKSENKKFNEQLAIETKVYNENELLRIKKENEQLKLKIDELNKVIIEYKSFEQNEDTDDEDNTEDETKESE